MRIEVKKTHFFVLLGALLLLAGSFFVYGYNANGAGGVPSVMGHSIDEIDWAAGLAKGLFMDYSDVYDVYIQGSSSGTSAGNARDVALAGHKTLDRLYVNLNSEYEGGTQIGKPVGISRFPDPDYDLRADGAIRASSFCIAGDCATSWAASDTVCPTGQFLDGDGSCRDSNYIVNQGGGGLSLQCVVNQTVFSSGNACVNVYCPDSYAVTGGGWRGPNSIDTVTDRPIDSGDGWRACQDVASNEGDVYAICCKIA